MHRRRSRRNEERRRRLLVSFFRLSAIAAVLAVIAWYAYEVGFRVATTEVGSLREQLKQAQAQMQQRDDQAESDKAALSEALKQAADYKALYDQAKPTDDMRDLMALLRSKMADGMDAHRLSLMIKSARAPKDCEMLASKRFLVKTPLYKGPQAITLARFDDVAVSADGIGANGGHDQAFDPERPVKLHLTAAGGKDAELSGNLPIDYVLAVRNSEYHFTISASAARGFVEVATERCNFR